MWKCSRLALPRVTFRGNLKKRHFWYKSVWAVIIAVVVSSIPTPTTIVVANRAHQYGCTPNRWMCLLAYTNNSDNNRTIVCISWKTDLDGRIGKRKGSLPKDNTNSDTHTGSYCSKVTTKGLRFFVFSTPQSFFVYFLLFCLIMSAAISLKINSRLLLTGNCFAPIFIILINILFNSTQLVCMCVFFM